MQNKWKWTGVVALWMCCVSTANASLIVFNDRDAFEAAAGSQLAFEGFNDQAALTVDIATGAGFNPIRRTTSHISEGDRAVSLMEFDTVTITFEHDVFAFGFDVNELNSNNLTYFDSAGNEIPDAFVVTDVWNASTFMGFVSDVAIRSFSLQGAGDQSNRTSYGIDALAYTAPATEVSEPTLTAALLLAMVMLVLTRKRAQ